MNFIYQFTRPIIFAHRGASAHAPENTLSAFKLAIEHGADAIELDAKLSADGEVVVIHDQTVDRTTNGHGAVGKLKLDELKSLDAGIRFGSEFSGERIPTLVEVFETVGQQLFINIELTNYASPNDGLVDRVVELVKRFHLEDRILFSSFHARNLARAGSLLPEVPCGMLAAEGWAGWVARSAIRRRAAPHALHPYFTDVSRALVEKNHGWNRRIFVWTVNDNQEMIRLFNLGVDGIFTDDPHLAWQVLRAK